MNKPVFYFLLLISTVTQAQNLVPNPSFEDTVYCPSSIGLVEASEHWFRPTNGSSDYFNICGSFGAEVPLNALGFQIPHDGNAYAGLITYNEDLSDPEIVNEREYLAIKLNSKLIAGEKYYWCFWASFGEISKYATNNLGIALSDNLVTDFSTIFLLDVPKYGHEIEIISDSIIWNLIQGNFVAEGNEEYLYIGNFFADIQTSIFEVTEIDPGGIRASYYYIDDVSLSQYPCDDLNQSVQIPNVFTPNGDGENDFFITTDHNLVDKEIRIYNRWGNLVYIGNENETWDGEFMEQLCPEGVYFAEVSFLNYKTNLREKKTGFVHLIR